MKGKISTVALLVAGLYASPVLAESFVAFGDSLTDTGQKDWFYPATFTNKSEEKDKKKKEKEKQVQQQAQNHLLYIQHLDPSIIGNTKGGYNFAYTGGVILAEHSKYDHKYKTKKGVFWDDILNKTLNNALFLRGLHNGKEKKKYDTSLLNEFFGWLPIVGNYLKNNPYNPQVALETQVEEYLKKGVKKDARHVLWIGANDVAAIAGLTVKRGVFGLKEVFFPEYSLTSSIWGGLRFLFTENKTELLKYKLNLNSAVGLVALGLEELRFMDDQTTKTAQELAKQVKTLQDAGVGQIILPTIPDISITPDYKSISSKASMFDKLIEEVLSKNSELGLAVKTLKLAPKLVDYLGSYLVHYTNEKITKQLIGTSENIVRIDSNALLKEIMANHTAYGITDITSKACDRSSSERQCTADASKENLFFTDGFHPSPLVHRIFADHIRNVIDAPKSFALPNRMLSEQGVLSAEHIYRNAFTPHKEGAFVDVAYDYSKHNRMMFVNAGAKMASNWQLQAQLGNAKGKLAENKTDIKDNASLMELALSYHQPNYFFGALVGGGTGKFDLTRFNLDGQVMHKQTADIRARHLHTGLFTGYQWVHHALSVQWEGDLTYSHTLMNSFNTRGKFYEMFVHKRKQHDLTLGSSLTIRGNGENWQPYLGTRFSQQWTGSPNPVKVTYNRLPFLTNIGDEKSFRRWNVKAGLDFQSTQQTYYFGTSVERDLKNALFQKGTTFHFNMGYHF